MRIADYARIASTRAHVALRAAKICNTPGGGGDFDEVAAAFDLACSGGRQQKPKRRQAAAAASAAAPESDDDSSTEDGLSDPAIDLTDLLERVLSENEHDLMEQFAAQEVAAAAAAAEAQQAPQGQPQPAQLAEGAAAEATVAEEELPQFVAATNTFVFPDGVTGGTFSSWPKATLANQRVKRRLHPNCVQTVATSKIPHAGVWSL